MEETNRIISVNDPAIDTERMPVKEIVEYSHTRDWSKVAPYLKPDVKPTVYHIRAVPHALWSTFVKSAVTDEGQWEQCFRAGVVEVENVYQPDGSFIAGKADMPRKKEWGDRVIAAEALTRFDHADIEEVGAVIWQMSFLARRKRGRYQLPPSCLATLKERDFLPADANPNSPAPSNGEASSDHAAPPTPGTTPSSESSSGSLTAATATGRPMEFESTPP